MSACAIIIVITFFIKTVSHIHCLPQNCGGNAACMGKEIQVVLCYNSYVGVDKSLLYQPDNL